jgi:hypothetical protein
VISIRSLASLDQARVTATQKVAAIEPAKPPFVATRTLASLDRPSATAQQGAGATEPGKPPVVSMRTLAALSRASAPAQERPAPTQPGKPPVVSMRTLDGPTAQDLQRSMFKPLDQVRAEAVLAEGPMPADCSAELFGGPEIPEPLHSWGCIDFQWAAPEVEYRPLYFDDIPLERYGQTVCPLLQPAVSGARFYAAVLCLPYKVAVDLPGDSIYTLGYYRPGDCVPSVRQGLR